VLSIGRLGPQSADYYLAQVAGGAEDYYLAGDQEAGRWLGGGAEQLDLGGRVAGDDLPRSLTAATRMTAPSWCAAPAAAGARPAST